MTPRDHISDDEQIASFDFFESSRSGAMYEGVPQYDGSIVFCLITKPKSFSFSWPEFIV